MRKASELLLRRRDVGDLVRGVGNGSRQRQRSRAEHEHCVSVHFGQVAVERGDRILDAAKEGGESGWKFNVAALDSLDDARNDVVDGDARADELSILMTNARRRVGTPSSGGKERGETRIELLHAH